MSRTAGRDQRPHSASVWREPMVWLIVGLPLLSVVMATTYAVFAFRVFDGVVEDDYYQRGKAINRVLRRDREAEARSLRAELALDERTGDLSVRFTSNGEAQLPPSVTVDLFHSTHAGADRRVELRRDGEGRYLGVIEPLPPGRYNVQAETASWRIVGELRAPADSGCLLAPAL